MKRASSILTMVLATVASLRAQSETNAAAAAPMDPEKISYAIGANIGETIRAGLYDINAEAVYKGIRDAMSRSLQMSEAEVGAGLSAYQQEVAKVRPAKNKEWLAQNRAKPGVRIKEVMLPDGSKAELQYRVTREGDGPTPGAGATVTVNYRGTLISGDEFDSTARHGGQPSKFVANRVIRGWTEALTMMRVGAKWELFIPAELAYGQGANGRIYPGATLIFEVELLGTETTMPPEPQAQVPPPATSSDIVRVPSAEELARGVKFETIRAEDAERMAKEAAAKAAATNKSGQ